MLIKGIEVGHLETNCYIVTDENTLDCAIIDPGDESNTIMDYVGWDATVFQTCIPNTEDCLFVYARGATSTIGAANEARAFAGVALMTDAS